VALIALSVFPVYPRPFKDLNFILEIFYLVRSILVGMSKRRLKFHIQANDYFGTLATVLDLVRQDLRRKREPQPCNDASSSARWADVSSAGIPDRENPDDQ
jgi:hypothetical protein